MRSLRLLALLYLPCLALACGIDVPILHAEPPRARTGTVAAPVIEVLAAGRREVVRKAAALGFPRRRGSESGLRAPRPGEDVQIGDPSTHYYDHEIWQPDSLICWQDDADLIWVARIDPQTGLLHPPSGRGWLVGRAARYEPAVNLFSWLGFGRRGTFAGPEWGLSQGGLGLYFTVVDENGVFQLARYRWNTRRVEQLTSGGTVDRRSQSPTKDADDPECRIVFFSGAILPQTMAAWQLESDPMSQMPVPLSQTASSGVRWIPGEHAVLTNLTDDDGVTQVAKYDVDAQATTFLTSGPAENSDPFVLNAPDRGGNQVLVCTQDRTKLALFENVAGTWSPLNVLTPAITLDPPEEMLVFSAELFVHNGRTYAFYGVTTHSVYAFPAYICVCSLDGTFNAVVSGREPIIRLDPEAYSSPAGLFIYYFTKEDDARHLRLCRVKLPDDPPSAEP